MKRVELLGMPVNIGLTGSDVVAALATGPLLIGYLNPFAWAVSGNQARFASQLSALDVVTCDGVAIQRALRRLHGQQTPIISLDYSGIAREYLQFFRQNTLDVCLVGGQLETVRTASRSLREAFPGLEISGAFPGYGDGPESATQYILANQPAVVLAGMGMGLQEPFLLHLREKGWRGRGICVGAFLDRLADPGLDYPEWSKRLNVRFLGNLARRPGYYLKRYGLDYWPFYKQYVFHLLGRSDSSS
ncbi:MAG: hypothetical protein HKO64_12075 [Xanthomonadales bacterium]|nr:WecB/TagA/CpsF family glycosyltransferase [Gammaproteobacteria bacterium]NNE04456.1 hypothetical protein [Xanthomonadales bacterium]NNL96350.1 hypothetical protein [Xanthomonadales bacterium]